MVAPLPESGAAPSTGGLRSPERQALKVIRPGTGNQSALPPDRSSQALQGFSDKSRARLRHLAENSTRPLISQFGLIYHRDCLRRRRSVGWSRRLITGRSSSIKFCAAGLTGTQPAA